MTDRAAQTAVPLHPLLAGRWSARAFDPDYKLEGDDLVALLEAARWAPSARNHQPWRFLAGRRGDATFDGLHATLNETNRIWAANAAAFVAALTETVGTDGVPQPTAEFDLGLATSQIIMQASALGLHARPMMGFSGQRLRERFHVPAEYKPVVVLALGRLGDPQALPEDLRGPHLDPRTRLPLEVLAF